MQDPTADIYGFVGIGGNFSSTWREKLKAAWAIIRGRECSVMEVIIDEFKATDMRNALNEFLTDLSKGKHEVHRETPDTEGR